MHSQMLSRIFNSWFRRAVHFLHWACHYHTQVHFSLQVDSSVLQRLASMVILPLHRPLPQVQLPGCSLHLQDLKHWFLRPAMDIFRQCLLTRQRSSQTRTGPQATIVQEVTDNRPAITSDILQIYPTIRRYYQLRTMQMPRQHRRSLGLDNNRGKLTAIMIYST
jgi:hypothetical protein